ncbi:uncharacterized protein PADG_06538 [Paracoccidioides brasiliensis Pb18]|uniref:Uncharacterized protein n=1 Tax=Paracoccidioides brasiliensis (strain Pb18) TaxID=502780 RepID=C1GGV1_PARBD|nr:uncharacterized protein PADG_06538 [Paracoccidioides brasiliensis Pb18]EEH50458.2 hypothetical protein PADG_06538 [Paracoccidioides brasiliensis Pb18]
MPKENLLRIKRSDSPGDYILVHVTRPGTEDLDLKLVATEGEAPYRASVKSVQVNKLRAKNYHGGDDEWTGILAYALGQRQSTSVPEEHKAGLKVVAAVKQDEDDESRNEIVITLMKRIDTITQRLGTIALKQDDDQAIQLFDWTGIAISRAEGLENQLLSLTAKYTAAESIISKLNAQLQELIKEKAQHDDQLIAKFSQLLNEKKLKIRNQQRLLAMARIDGDKGAVHILLKLFCKFWTCSLNVHPANPPYAPTIESSVRQRHPKRKAPELSISSESEDGFDTMDVDQGGNPATNKSTTTTNSNNNNNNNTNDTSAVNPDAEDDLSSTSERQDTPDPLEDEDEETATEDEMDPPQSPPAPAAPAATAVSDGRKRGACASSKQPVASSPTTRTAREPMTSPPPRRELPFVRRMGRGKAPMPFPDEDEDEDDEL